MTINLVNLGICIALAGVGAWFFLSYIRSYNDDKYKLTIATCIFLTALIYIVCIIGTPIKYMMWEKAYFNLTSSNAIFDAELAKWQASYMQWGIFSNVPDRVMEIVSTIGG